MKRISTLKNLLIVFCLLFGIKNIQAQTCSLTAGYNVGANGVVSFTGSVNPWTGSPYFYWYFPGSTTPAGPQGNLAWNATATYSANGTYSVVFGAANSVPSCSASITITISVNTVTNNPGPGPCTLNVQYSAPTNGCNGSATVSPGNMCTPVSYTWSNLSTGSTISGLCAGTSYSVIASGPAGVNCCSVAAGVVTIPTVNPCSLNANFGWTTMANGVINFNNMSTGTTGGSTYGWAFGDGGTATGPVPVHTYTANGVYGVTLTVNNNSNPACTDVQVYNVLVNSFCTLNAGFTMSNQTSNSIMFTNTTTGNYGPVSYTWNFGDGSNLVFPPNIAHTYTAPGTYTVILTANNFSLSTTCIDTAMAVVTINTICAANASFSLSPTSTPQYWIGFPLSPANITGAMWYWGDGSTSNTLYTSHTYSAAGNYSICLTVTVNCGLTAASCYSYAINRSETDMSIVTVNIIDPATVGIKNMIADNFNYSISPNPNNGSFNLNVTGLPAGTVKISVYNLVGELVYQSQSDTGKTTLSKEIQISESPGVYFLQVNSNNKVLTKKVVINK